MKKIITGTMLVTMAALLFLAPSPVEAGWPTDWEWEYVWGHMVDWNGDDIKDGCCCCENYVEIKCRYKKTNTWEKSKNFDEFLYDDGTTLYFKATVGSGETFAVQDNSGTLVIAVPKTEY